jgi:peptidoglycan/xylan/chitin deacetylase (PgdA/CDA1 family)
MIEGKFFVLSTVILVVTLLFHLSAYADTLGSIAINIPYTNGDRADYSSISMKIYQDNKQIPYQDIESITGNPFNIVSLPLGHQYKIDLYANGMYASSNYVDLEQTHQDVNANIPLPGGMRVNVLYNDDLTPVTNAFVDVKSADSKIWSSGFTDMHGQTLRFWLAPTTEQSDNYTVDVKIGQHLLYSHKPIFLLPGISQEIYIVTPWTPLINSLITVTVYDSQSKLVSPPVGTFVVDLFDDQGNMVMKSPINNRGETDFYNLKVGDYEFRIINLKDNSIWGDSKFTIDGTQLNFAIKENQTQVFENVTMASTQSQAAPTPQSQIPQIPRITGCNCVAFRLDNVQDYWLDNAQIGLIDTFKQKDASLTLGIIAKVFGNDSKLVNDVKNQVSVNNQSNDVGINGWDFEDFTSFNETQQKSLLEQSKSRLVSIIGVTPSIFVPPYGKVNQDTFQAMQDSGIYYVTGTSYVTLPPNITNNIHNIPATVFTGYYHLENGSLELATDDMIMSQIQASIQNYGFADVTLNFQDYALNNGTLKVNSPDSSQIEKLESLIDMVRSNGLRIVKVSEIANKTSTTHTIPSWVKNSANFWSKNKTSSSDFLIGIQYMIKQNIVKGPIPQHVLKAIPSWTRNSAGWWSSGLISDDDFINGIEFLINEKIIN